MRRRERERERAHIFLLLLFLANSADFLLEVKYSSLLSPLFKQRRGRRGKLLSYFNSPIFREEENKKSPLLAWRWQEEEGGNKWIPPNETGVEELMAGGAFAL